MTKRKRQACSREDSVSAETAVLAKYMRTDHGRLGRTDRERISISLLAKRCSIVVPPVPREISDPRARKKWRRCQRKKALFKLDFPAGIQSSEPPTGMSEKMQKRWHREEKITALWAASKHMAGRGASDSIVTESKPVKHSYSSLSSNLRDGSPSKSGAESVPTMLAQHWPIPATAISTTTTNTTMTKQADAVRILPKQCNLVRKWSMTQLPASGPRKWCDAPPLHLATEAVKRPGSGKKLVSGFHPQARLRTIPSWKAFAEPRRATSSRGGDPCSYEYESIIANPEDGSKEATAMNKAISVPTYFHVGTLEQARHNLLQAEDESEDEDTTSNIDASTIDSETVILQSEPTSLPNVHSYRDEGQKIADFIQRKTDTSDAPPTSPIQILDHGEAFSRDHNQLPFCPPPHHDAVQPDGLQLLVPNARRPRSDSRNSVPSEDIAIAGKGSEVLVAPILDPVSNDYNVLEKSNSALEACQVHVVNTVGNRKRKATKSKSPHFKSQHKQKKCHALSPDQRSSDNKPVDIVEHHIEDNLDPTPSAGTLDGDAIHTGVSVAALPDLVASALLADPTDVVVENVPDCDRRNPRRLVRTRSKTTGVTSDYFIPENVDQVDRPNRKRVSAVRRHPVTDIAFGIIQEKTWPEPFWLLIAVKFLNVTRGRAAIPIFWELKAQYSTPKALALADQEELMNMTRPLGLQKVRSFMMIQMAKAWIERPPTKGIRFRTLHYPDKNNGKQLKKCSILEDSAEISDGALEIGGFPGCNRYAYDSWRIFCRDVCRGVAEDYEGTGAASEFQPEWQRVLPQDKELRAFLAWMWLRQGWIWNCMTGEKVRASDEQMEQAKLGTLGIEVQTAITPERETADCPGERSC